MPSRFSRGAVRGGAAPKKLLLVENGSHNNSMWTGAGAYQQAIVELFGPHGAPEGETHVDGESPSLCASAEGQSPGGEGDRVKCAVRRGG